MMIMILMLILIVLSSITITISISSNPPISSNNLGSDVFTIIIINTNTYQ